MSIDIGQGSNLQNLNFNNIFKVTDERTETNSEREETSSEENNNCMNVKPGK